MKYTIKIHNKEHYKAVEARLIELGYMMGRYGNSDLSDFEALDFFQFSEDYPLDSGRVFNRGGDRGKLVTLEDLYSDRSLVYKTAEVKLNSEYTAVVTKSGISVGCQTFKPKVIDKLFEVWESVR